LELGSHIRLYEVEGDSYLDIPKWLNHQKIDHPAKSRLPEYREVLASHSEEFANEAETFAPHTLDLGPVPRTVDLVPTGASAPAADEEPNDGPRTKLPPGWRPEVDDRDYASDKGLDPDTVTAAFTDYFGEGRGRNEKRTRAGWSKRWRVWCNTDAERKPAVRSGPGFRSATPGGDAGAFARAAARLGRDEPVQR
jgi:hypothetical protein